MFHYTEAKPQTWRALAIFEDGSECLLCLGRSTTQVRDTYAGAFAQVLPDEERSLVRRIALQCWQGAPDQGHWLTKAALALPAQGRADQTASPAELDCLPLPARGVPALAAPDAVRRLLRLA